MNWGLSPKLLTSFNDIVPVARPLVLNKKVKDPHSLSGFISAEGCFMVSIRESKTHSLGFQVILMFELTQQSRDKQLIQSFINYFGCGKYYARANKDVCEFKITKFKDITEKIIPFFKKYPIVVVKAKYFADWCKVAELMKEKKTPDYSRIKAN